MCRTKLFWFLETTGVGRLRAPLLYWVAGGEYSEEKKKKGSRGVAGLRVRVDDTAGIFYFFLSWLRFLCHKILFCRDPLHIPQTKDVKMEKILISQEELLDHQVYTLQWRASLPNDEFLNQEMHVNMSAVEVNCCNCKNAETVSKTHNA